tara:strand:- start:455 stop:2167 length:1713 start_codon:yes stop_codon:yes gene_type:complete
MASIQIADNDARVQYTQAVTANSTSLTIDFPFFDLDDINVIVTTSAGVDTTLTRGTGTGTFAVTGTAVDDGFSGGSITLGDSYSNTHTYTIFRDIEASRTTDFATSGPFNISSLNTELDKIYAIIQQIETENNRALTLPQSDATASITLPTKSSRLGKYLAFHETTGLATVGGDVADTGTVAAQSANISTLAGISANITTVAGVASNIPTLAGISSNISLLGASDVVADMALLATTDVIADMALLANSDVISDMNTLATSDIISDLNTLATSDIVTDMNLLATSANVTAMANLGTSTNVTNMANLNASGVIANINTLSGILSGSQTFVVTVAGGKFVIDGVSAPALTLIKGHTYTFDVSDNSNATHILGFKDSGGNVLSSGITANGTPGQAGATVVYVIPSTGTQPASYYCTQHSNMGNTITTRGDDIAQVASVATEVALLGTSAVVEDMGFLGTSANVTAMGLLGTSAVVEDMGFLGTSANVTAMGHLGTSANVTAMGLLGTSAVVEDMGFLGTSANVGHMATLGASGVVANIATVATDIANVNTVASNIGTISAKATKGFATAMAIAL